MTSANDYPFSACRTHLDFWLRSAQLLQENQEQWMRLCTQIAQEDIRLRQAEIAQLRDAKDWSSLALLAPMAGWHNVQERMAVLQGVAQTAINSQTALYAEYRKAWEELQAIAGQPGAAPAAPAAPKAAPAETPAASKPRNRRPR